MPTAANFHSLIPTTKNIVAPAITSMTAVPRSGWRSTRKAGTRTISTGASKRLGRPTSSIEMPWK